MSENALLELSRYQRSAHDLRAELRAEWFAARNYRRQQQTLRSMSKAWWLNQDQIDWYEDQAQVLGKWAREHLIKAKGIKRRL